MASPRRTGDDDQCNGNMASRYHFIEKLGAGTYGTVYKALCRRTRNPVAIKRIRIGAEEDGVPATALREIQVLKDCEGHRNVVKLHEVDCSDEINKQGVAMHHLDLVFECLDMDLRVYLKKHGAMRDATLRSAALQLVTGLEYCHGKRILHRDLKPQNVLVDLATMRLCLADFGLARAYNVPLKVYTHEVVTLWYRAPEILLGQARYGPPMDVWSLGCIISEMATGKELFPGDSEIGTIFKMYSMLGTPTEEVWPGLSTLEHYKSKSPKWRDTNFADVRRLAGPGFGDCGVDLLRQCLQYNSVNRSSANALKAHPFFQGADRSLHSV